MAPPIWKILCLEKVNFSIYMLTVYSLYILISQRWTNLQNTHKKFHPLVLSQITLNESKFCLQENLNIELNGFVHVTKVQDFLLLNYLLDLVVYSIQLFHCLPESPDCLVAGSAYLLDPVWRHWRVPERRGDALLEEDGDHDGRTSSVARTVHHRY